MAQLLGAPRSKKRRPGEEGEGFQASAAAAEEEEDRISALPEDLRLRILALLPLKSAIRTGALSTQWRALWARRWPAPSSLELYLRSGDTSKQLLESLQRRGLHRLDRFSLAMDMNFSSGGGSSRSPSGRRFRRIRGWWRRCLLRCCSPSSSSWGRWRMSRGEHDSDGGGRCGSEVRERSEVRGARTRPDGARLQKNDRGVRFSGARLSHAGGSAKPGYELQNDQSNSTRWLSRARARVSSSTKHSLCASTPITAYLQSSSRSPEVLISMQYVCKRGHSLSIGGLARSASPNARLLQNQNSEATTTKAEAGECLPAGDE